MQKTKVNASGKHYSRKFVSNNIYVFNICEAKCTHQKEEQIGVPVVAQWLTNPTRNHEVVGSVPALAQWVDDPALSQTRLRSRVAVALA